MINVYISEALFFLSDMFCCVTENSRLPEWMCWASNMSYFFWITTAPMLWLRCVHFTLGVRYNRKQQIAVALPWFVVIVCTLLSPVTGLMFSIKPGNVYARGPLHVAQPIACIIYLTVATVKAFQTSFFAASSAQKRRTLTFAIYGLFPALGGLMELFFSELPLLAPVTTFAMLFMCLNLQQQMISRDALTELNNRFELIRYLENRAVNPPKTGMVLMMMDIDDFKHINDTYGHVEGDEALRRFAKVLKKVAAEFNCFVVRYGGDEFTIVCEPGSLLYAANVCNRLREILDADNEKQTIKLSVSIGCAKYDETMSINENIDASDRKLYMEKKIHGRGR